MAVLLAMDSLKLAPFSRSRKTTRAKASLEVMTPAAVLATDDHEMVREAVGLLAGAWAAGAATALCTCARRRARLGDFTR